MTPLFRPEIFAFFSCPFPVMHPTHVRNVINTPTCCFLTWTHPDSLGGSCGKVQENVTFEFSVTAPPEHFRKLSVQCTIWRLVWLWHYKYTFNSHKSRRHRLLHCISLSYFPRRVEQQLGSFRNPTAKARRLLQRLRRSRSAFTEFFLRTDVLNKGSESEVGPALSHELLPAPLPPLPFLWPLWAE